MNTSCVGGRRTRAANHKHNKTQWGAPQQQVTNCRTAAPFTLVHHRKMIWVGTPQTTACAGEPQCNSQRNTYTLVQWGLRRAMPPVRYPRNTYNSCSKQIGNCGLIDDGHVERVLMYILAVADRLRGVVSTLLKRHVCGCCAVY